MNLKVYYFCLFFGLAIPVSTLAEYQTESVFDTDYKCIADEEGGYNHRSSGHVKARFRPSKEFFLTHISNFRKETIFKMKSAPIIESLDHDEDLVRAEVEDTYMKQEKPFGSLVVEEGSYFIREPDDDPTLQWISGKCEAFWDGEGKSITCKPGTYQEFVLNIETGRFSYSYLGSWHNEHKEDYYGDSSVFAFGKCKKYYR